MKTVLLLLGFFICCTITAQDNIRDSASSLLRKGDFDGAVKTLKDGLKTNPGNTKILQDLAFAYYLSRDYSNAIETSKTLIQSPGADAQAYQVLGLIYKAIADYDNCEKLYKEALIKFPNSGMLYSEYGELMYMKKIMPKPLRFGEKGIQQDPNNSSNYYFASRYYGQNNKPLWAVLYGETFINLESFTQRTADVKKVVTDNYTALFTLGTFASIAASGNDFEKSVSSLFNNYARLVANGVTPESATALRTKFIIDWFDHYASKYPFRLFDHMKFLLQKNMFDAYNQWVFNSPAGYNAWLSSHTDEAAAFKNYQRSIVYKIPPGQYYAMH